MFRKMLAELQYVIYIGYIDFKNALITIRVCSNLGRYTAAIIVMFQAAVL